MGDNGGQQGVSLTGIARCLLCPTSQEAPSQAPGPNGLRALGRPPVIARVWLEPQAGHGQLRCTFQKAQGAKGQVQRQGGPRQPEASRCPWRQLLQAGAFCSRERSLVWTCHPPLPKLRVPFLPCPMLAEHDWTGSLHHPTKGTLKPVLPPCLGLGLGGPWRCD